MLTTLWGVKTFQLRTTHGALVSNIVLDTTQVATDTLDYAATDGAGLTATATRSVIIEALTPLSTASSSSTLAQ